MPKMEWSPQPTCGAEAEITDQEAAKLWRLNRERLQELWWRDFAALPASPRHEDLLQSAAECRIKLEGWIQPVCFRYHPGIPDSLQPHSGEGDVAAHRREQSIEQQLKAAILGQCFQPDFRVQLISVSHNLWVLLLFSETPAPAQAENCCRLLTEFCCRAQLLSMCLLGRPTDISGLHGELQRLKRAGRDHVYLDNRVMPAEPSAVPAGEAPQLNLERWLMLLDCGMYREAMAEIRSFFLDEAVVPNVDAWFLEDFRHSFLVGVRELETVRKRQLDLISGLPEHLMQYGAETVPDILSLVDEVIARVMEHADHERDHRRLASELKSYISEHLAEELSRSSIALHFYISADYLDRVFKKECGMTITDYVLQERLNMARTLLAGSSLTVTQIAARLGFVNFSYFSNVFKKHYGITPNAWRKQAQQEA